MLFMARKVTFSLPPLKRVISILVYVNLPWLLSLVFQLLRWGNIYFKLSEISVKSGRPMVPFGKNLLKGI